MVALISGILREGSLGAFPRMLLGAVADGGTGSLSTVSTFVVEVADKLPPIYVAGQGNSFVRSGPFYALASLLGGLALGALIYLPWLALLPAVAGVIYLPWLA